MKKLLFPAIGALAISLIVGQYALAATTGTVGATVTVQNVSVSVTDGTVAYGSMALNATKSTTAADLNDLQTATNDGNVTEQFNIKGMDATGSTQTWILAATAGSAQYIHGFCKVTCTTPPTGYTALTTSYATLAASVTAAGTQTFDLYINTPTATTDYTTHTADVTVQAVAI